MISETLGTASVTLVVVSHHTENKDPGLPQDMDGPRVGEGGVCSKVPIPPWSSLGFDQEQKMVLVQSLFLFLLVQSLFILHYVSSQNGSQPLLNPGTRRREIRPGVHRAETGTGYTVN